MFVPCIDCRLRHKPCFRPFTDEELKSISSLKTNHVAVPAKTDIVSEGEVGGSLYTLYEGWAFRYKTLAGGARQILDLLLPGEIIGLSSALLGTIRHSVQTLTPVSLCVLDGYPLPKLLRRHVYLMLETFERLRRLELANGTMCPFPLQRQHLADAAGLSMIHLNRTLAQLRDERLAALAVIVELAAPERGEEIARRKALDDGALAQQLVEPPLRRREAVERDLRVHVMRRVVHDVVRDCAVPARHDDMHRDLLLSGEAAPFRRPGEPRRALMRVLHVGGGAHQQVPHQERHDEAPGDRRRRA